LVSGFNGFKILGALVLFIKETERVNG